MAKRTPSDCCCGDQISPASAGPAAICGSSAWGQGIDIDRTSADYEHGVLSVMLPVSEKARPRKVAVTTRGESAALTVPENDQAAVTA